MNVDAKESKGGRDDTDNQRHSQKEVGRPVLILDVGSLMGSLVGQSEERTRQALRVIDAMARNWRRSRERVGATVTASEAFTARQEREGSQRARSLSAELHHFT